MIDLGSRYITCDECPLGAEDILDRYERLKGYDDGDWQPEYCGCDKIGTMFLYGDYCEDAFCNKTPSGTSGQRKTGRAYRRVMLKQKTNRLMKIVNSSYIPHAGYVDWGWVDNEWVQVGKYVKYPKNSNKQRWMKRYTSRVSRKTDLPQKGNAYRRCFDYWWTMY